MRRRLTALVASAALGGVVLAGCSGGGGSSNVDVGPAAAVPANAAIYLDATVRPTGSAESQAKEAAGKILNTSDPGSKIASLIDQQSKSSGHPINYDQDIKPWLGNQAGLFFTSFGTNPDGAFVIETTNPQAALAAGRKAEGATPTNPQPKTYNGSSYQVAPDDPTTVFGTVGTYLVEGSEAGFKSVVDAAKGDSLGDSSDFKDAIDNLPGDRLGTFYSIPKTLIAAIPSGQVNPGAQALIQKAGGESLEKPLTGSLTASSDNLDLEFQSTGVENVNTPESALLGDVPGDAWLALGIGDLGATARRVIDQLKTLGIPNLQQGLAQAEAATGSSVNDLTGAFGDAVIYVKGTSQKALSGALVVHVNNPELTGRLLGQLQSLLSFSGAVKPLSVPGGGTGFQYHDPTQTPQPVEVAQKGDKLVVGYGPGSAQEALQPSQPLSSSSSFTSAKDQVSSLGADLFLSFPQVFQLAESSGSNKDPQYQQAKPFIQHLKYLVSGSGSEDGNAVLKAVLGLK
jgi:Protein of unknown function (DUF3352)